VQQHNYVNNILLFYNLETIDIVKTTPINFTTQLETYSEKLGKTHSDTGDKWK